MKKFLFNQKPMIHCPLDPDYSPIILGNLAYQNAVNNTEKPTKIKIALERSEGQVSTITTHIFDESLDQFQANYLYIERLVKTMLWLYGGYKVFIGGNKQIGEAIKKAYQENGQRVFDAAFMSNVYENPFEVFVVDINDVPDTHQQSKPVGRHLDGYRIGFDAGGSDRKVSAVVNGEAIFSEEVVWHPKTNSDPSYHYAGILDSIKRAASKMPRIDAIGVSSAGIFIDNRIAVASLFRQVSQTEFDEKVRTMYLDIAKEMGNVPIEVANDGDVTALAGAMSLGSNKVLGIAMGTSEAAGYVNAEGNITGWLNELAFVPVDYNENSMLDEWSMDYGCGVTYFSQDSVIKLAGHAGIQFDENLSPAEKLEVVQDLHENNDPKAIEIFTTIGVYLGYTIAYYAQFYDIEHLLVLGRVTSQKGGDLIIKIANDILEKEFPQLYRKMNVTLPDEKSRRVGQSIAAASLPKL